MGRAGDGRLAGAVVLAEAVAASGAAAGAVLAGEARKLSCGAPRLSGRPRGGGRRCPVGVGGKGRLASGPLTAAADEGRSGTSASRRHRRRRRRWPYWRGGARSPSGGGRRLGGQPRGGLRRRDDGVARGGHVAGGALIVPAFDWWDGVGQLAGAMVVAAASLAVSVAVLSGGRALRWSGGRRLCGRPRGRGRRHHVSVVEGGRVSDGALIAAFDTRRAED